MRAINGILTETHMKTVSALVPDLDQSLSSQGCLVVMIPNHSTSIRTLSSAQCENDSSGIKTSSSSAWPRHQYWSPCFGSSGLLAYRTHALPISGAGMLICRSMPTCQIGLGGDLPWTQDPPTNQDSAQARLHAWTDWLAAHLSVRLGWRNCFLGSAASCRRFTAPSSTPLARRARGMPAY